MKTGEYRPAIELGSRRGRRFVKVCDYDPSREAASRRGEFLVMGCLGARPDLEEGLGLGQPDG